MKTKQRNVSFLPTQFVVVYLFIIYLLYIWQIYLKNLVWSFELTLSYLIYFYTFYNAIKRQHSSATFRNDFRLHSHFSKENIKHILFSECLKSFFFNVKETLRVVWLLFCGFLTVTSVLFAILFLSLHCFFFSSFVLNWLLSHSLCFDAHFRRCFFCVFLACLLLFYFFFLPTLCCVSFPSRLRLPRLSCLHRRLQLLRLGWDSIFVQHRPSAL